MVTTLGLRRSERVIESRFWKLCSSSDANGIGRMLFQKEVSLLAALGSTFTFTDSVISSVLRESLTDLALADCIRRESLFISSLLSSFFSSSWSIFTFFFSSDFEDFF